MVPFILVFGNALPKNYSFCSDFYFFILSIFNKEFSKQGLGFLLNKEPLLILESKWIFFMGYCIFIKFLPLGFGNPAPKLSTFLF